MKIAGGLTIILVLGALEPLRALSTPLGNEDGGAGVAYNKKEGLTLEQKDNKVTESHKRSEAGGNSHVTGSDGSVTDSEFNKSHQEDKKDETKNTRKLSIGGEDGGLNYAQTKETSGTSQQTDKETSRIRQKQEESGDGYYYKRESKNEDKNKQVKKESYEKKESSGFRLGKDGFQKGKTESSEKLKTSETNERSSSNQELEEESIQDGDKSNYINRSSDSKNEVKNSRSSETRRQFSSDGGVKNDDAAKAGEDSPKNSTSHYTGFEEEFESSENDGVKSSRASGFVQEDSKIYSHVGGESWTNTGDKKVDKFFTESDNLSGSNVDDPSKLRRKRHTIYTSENENNDHKQEEHLTNYDSEQVHLIHNNEQHRSPTNENQENINRGNHQFLGLQHGNENAAQHTNYGLEKIHLTHNNQNHRSSNNGAQENINRGNHQYLELQHGNENSKFKNTHQADEVNHFYGNEHHDFNHGSYGFEERHQYSPSSYNREHESKNGNYNLNRRNSNHYSVNLGSEKIRHENHRSESTFHYPEKSAVNLRNAENANEFYGNRNYGSINDNYKKSNLHSGNANQQSVSLRNGNSNDNYEHRNGKVYLTNPGKEYYRPNNGGSKNQYVFGSESNRSNRQGQTLKYYSSSENGNLGSRGRSYRLGNTNYGPVPLRNDNSRIINNARNYLYGGRNYGNRQYRFGNGFNGNNAHTRISQLGRLESGDQQLETVRYRQGVKHEDVRRFLSSNGHQISNEYQRFNTGNHIRHYEPYYTGYRPASNGYLRRYGAYNNRVATHGAIDLHHLVDNTHYSTGNGRYVFKLGKNGDDHRYYDTLTGLHFNIRKIRLHSGKNVIVPGNYANHPPNNGQPGVEHDNSGQGLDLGCGIFYIGGGNYRHQDQIIPATKIEVYLKTLGISGISLTLDGLPLGLSGGYFPLNLGSGLTYQGDGTYKYQDSIIAHDKIIEFCKSKHINKISFTKDGYPEDLFNGSLDSIFKTHLKLPIDLGNGLEFIGNGHYKWKDQIIPTIKIVEFINEHNLDIEITKEGLPLTLFNGTLAINVGSTVDGNVDCKEDDLLNPHGIFPYDVGFNIYYDGKGNYIYKNITIPRSNIIEFCKSHDLTNISFTDDGFPSSLFNETEHGDIGHNWKYPIYLGDDLYYIDNGHYKYKNQIILACDIGEFIKTNKINVHITKQGLPLGVYFGSLDNIFSPDEKDDVGHESEPINHHEGYPLDLGSKLFYLGNGSYIYDNNEIIHCKDIIEFCKSYSITNITFTNDGFPSDLFKNIKDGGSESHSKFPIDLGNDLLYYECGHYRHKNKTIPVGDIVEYIKEIKLNVSVTDDGLPLQLVAVNFDRGFAPYDNEVSGVHKKVLLDIYGDFPYDLGYNIYYLGNGSYRCDNRIIDCIDILNYCKSHQINDIVFTEDGFPASLFNYTVSDEGSYRKFPIDLGKGLRFIGHGHYDYENKIYPCSNIIDVVKILNLNISLTDDGIPVELIDENELSSFDNTAIDLGKDLFYDHGQYSYQNETIPADKTVEFSKSLDLNISFTEDGYPQLHNDEQTVLSHENEDRECPKGPIDLGEEIVYIGDCHYMYQDHVIPAKYILGLLDILHIHDIQLPVGPDDNFTSKGDSNDTYSKDDHTLDLGFEVFSLGNGTYKYKNRYIPGECYADFLKILGLKIQSEDSEILVEDNKKSDSSEEDILALIDELLKNNNTKTTEAQYTSTNDDITSEDTKNQNDSSNEQQSSDLQKSIKSTNDDDSGSNQYIISNTSSVTSLDSTSEDTSLSTNSSDSTYSSDDSTVILDTSSDYSSKNSSIRLSVESSSSNDTTTNYDSKTTDQSFGNSSTIESKESSEKNCTDSYSYDNSSFSSDNSTVILDTSSDYSSKNSSIRLSVESSSSNDTTTNYDSKTTDQSFGNSSTIESKESSEKNCTDSYSYDNSTFSSDNSTVILDTSSDYSSKNSSIRLSVESSSSNDTTTNYDSKTTDQSFGNSSTIESKESSEKNCTDTYSYDNSTFSSDNSTVILDTSSDYSSKNSSIRLSVASSSSNDTTTNYDSKTTDQSFGNSSTIESKESSEKNCTDSYSYDNSTFSSDNSTVTSVNLSDTNDSSSSLKDIDTTSDSCNNSSNTENNDSSRTNPNDSPSSDNNSTRSDNSSIVLENSSSNSSTTEYIDLSSCNDSTTNSNDTNITSEGSADATTTENSNYSTTNSPDSSSTDDTSSSSNDSITTSTSSSDNTSDKYLSTTSSPSGL